MLHVRGRIQLDRPVADWLAQALARPGVSEVPVTVPIALAAATLPDDFPRDPAGRLIYATARAQGAALVTMDARLRDLILRAPSGDAAARRQAAAGTASRASASSSRTTSSVSRTA